jgi:hypothetical protein
MGKGQRVQCVTCGTVFADTGRKHAYTLAQDHVDAEHGHGRIEILVEQL